MGGTTLGKPRDLSVLVLNFVFVLVWILSL
jgi:hypothetical protein